MQSQRLKFIFAIIITIPLFVDAQDQKVKEQWEKDLLAYPVPPSAIKLEKSFSFPLESLSEKDIYLALPRALAQDSEGNIYVVDQALNRILEFNNKGDFVKQIGRPGQGPGEFVSPYNISISQDDILIVGDIGNMRLQFFDKEGRFINSFKMFGGYFSWVLDRKHMLFAVPYLSPKRINKAVDVLSDKGIILNSFGEALKIKYPATPYSDAKIDLTSKGDILFAFSFVPIVRRYSHDGELLAEYNIDHKLMKASGEYNLENQSLLAEKKKPSFREVISSLRASSDGFYLMRSHPRIEIMEFDATGKKINHWWGDLGADNMIGDFIVQTIDNRKVFFLLEQYPGVSVHCFR